LPEDVDRKKRRAQAVLNPDRYQDYLVDDQSETAKGWRFGVRRASVLEAVRRHLAKPDFEPGEWMNVWD